MKAILVLVIALVLLVLVGDPEVADAQIVLKFGHDSPTTHPYHTLVAKFKEVLETETKGAVTVQIFPNAQLGAEARMIEGLRLGTIDGLPTATSAMARFVPEIELFNLPFLFTDLAHLYRVVDGPVGEDINKAIASRMNVVVLGWMSAGVRNMWNSKRPILAPADLKGIKMRVITSPIMIDTFNTLGAQATPIPFPELYAALQQGVVDGADNDVVDLLTHKFYEVTKYVSSTNHMIIGTAFVLSQKRYASLPPDVQVAVVKAGQVAVPAARKAWGEFAQAAVEQLKAKGLQFYTVDQKPFRDAVQAIHEKYADKVGGMKLIEQIRKQ